jgi:ribonuclease P protein component
MAMRRQQTLRRRRDFQAVFERGRAFGDRLLVLRSLPNNLDHSRYGFVTSKRIGNAVVRNRVRRRLREAMRALPTESGRDIVVAAKVAAAGADFHQLSESIAALTADAGILREERHREEATS